MGKQLRWDDGGDINVTSCLILDLCFCLFLQLYVVSQYKILVSLLGKFLSLTHLHISPWKYYIFALTQSLAFIIWYPMCFSCREQHPRPWPPDLPADHGAVQSQRSHAVCLWPAGRLHSACGKSLDFRRFPCIIVYVQCCFHICVSVFPPILNLSGENNFHFRLHSHSCQL